MPRRPMAELTPEEQARERERSRAWKKAHPEKVNAEARRRRARNPAKHREAVHKSQEKHPETLPRAKKRWRQNNPEKVRAQKKRSWTKHAPRINAERRAKRQAHLEEENAKRRAKEAENLEKTREQRRANYAKSYAKNPDSWLTRNHRRRARKQSAPLDDLTAAQHRAVIATAHGVCPYCPHYNPGCQACKKGTHKLTVDHLTPFADGGANTLHNLVACCLACNVKKHTGKPPVPVQPLLL